MVEAYFPDIKTGGAEKVPHHITKILKTILISHMLVLYNQNIINLQVGSEFMNKEELHDSIELILFRNI